MTNHLSHPRNRKEHKKIYNDTENVATETAHHPTNDQ